MREARFVDLVQEPLTKFSDAQIGAASPDVLRDCQRVLERMFALQPVSDAPENNVVETPSNLQDGRWRVSGKVQGEPPFRGRLVHHGWEATRCELPQWNGSDELLSHSHPPKLNAPYDPGPIDPWPDVFWPQAL